MQHSGLSLVVASRGSFLVAMRRLLIVVAPLMVHRLSGTRALVVVTQGLRSCSLQAPDYRIISCEEWTQLSCCLWGSSETRDQTSVPGVARWTLNHKPLVLCQYWWVTKSCPTPRRHELTVALPGSSVHALSWQGYRSGLPISFFKRSSWSRDQMIQGSSWSHISYIGRQILYCWATREASVVKINNFSCL